MKLSVLLSVVGVSGLVWVCPVVAETGRLGVLKDTASHNWETREKKIYLNHGGMAEDLLAQGITRVTGVQVNQTPDGLELILNTVAGSERLVPLILPQGNDLVIDLLDATLAFSIRNGVTETNPAPGISRIAVNKVDDSSIRVTITGENQTPSADVVPGRDDLVLSVTPQDTTAQEEPDEEIEVIATGEAEEDDDYFVPEAGVTRNNTPIIDTPSTVQVVPRQIIEDQGTTELSDALSRNAVGVVGLFSPRSNFNNVTIRGFNVSSNFLRNGIPESYSFTPPRDLSNVERLEILSGPASVAGGQISPGGIVNIITKQPLSTPLYELSASYGSFNSVESGLDFSGPLNDSKTVAYRLNASYYHSDTLVDADDVGVDRFSIAPVISWQISEQTKLTFEGQYLDSRTPQRIDIPSVGTVFDNPNGEIPRDQFVGEPDFDGNDRKITQIGYDLEHSFSDNWSLRQAFRYSNLQTEQREAFVRALQDDFRTLERTADIGTSDFNNYQATAYVTGKFKTGGIDHELLAGVDYVFEEQFSEDEDFEVENIDLFEPEYTGIGEAVEGSFRREYDKNDGVGIYLQDQIKFFDERLILALGGRVDFVGSSAEDLLDEAAEEDSQDDTAFSPQVGIVYKVTDDISLYGSFSRSFEQQTGETAEAEIFEPSRGTQYEVGTKVNWIDEQLFTTLAFYDLTQTNLTTEDPEDPDFEVQTGEQNSQGIELQTKGEILPGWNITASYAYTDAKVTEDNVIPVGTPLRGVPENAASLWTTYTISEGSLSGLGFGLGMFYVGERTGTFRLENSFQLDDYFRTDAAIYYRRDDLNLTLNFNNLFDVDYIETSVDDLRVSPADPFTVTGSVSYKF